ncbi:hypothetical protein DPMN_070131 [Dreissena polymorpha]|uniref:Uncharacterized protein n=1 Tax=Dreissena polymorpha TaxID=45954 RepID=A0A9D4BVF5_DREPO|nr:hypothetical protein DPMN_070131 [Dreissena polymorpha]
MFTDSSSSVSSTLPVGIVLNSANPAQYADPHPLLPCIKCIELKNITCSSTLLRSLLSTLLTLDNGVTWHLTECYILSCKEDAVRWAVTETFATLSLIRKACTLEMPLMKSGPGLWEALHGLDIKSLCLSGGFSCLNVNHADSMSQSLSSLTHLDTLSIKGDDDSPDLWKALHGLNIKSLSLNGRLFGLNVNHADSLSQTLSSLTHLNTLSIKSVNCSPDLLEALHGLNIKSLSLSGAYGGLKVNYADLMSQSLSSLTHLDTLSIEMDYYSPGLWEALHGLNIKSLSVSGAYPYGGSNINCADLMSQSLLSLTHLDTLSIKVDDDSPGLWEALHGLNIKSLSLSGRYGSIEVHYADSMSQSLSSLTHLDTLSIKVDDDSPGLWKALHGLNIISLSLSGTLRGLCVHYADLMSQSLSSLTHLDTLSIEANYYSRGLWDALHVLNIKSLSLSVWSEDLNVNNVDSVPQSLSSLTHLNTLSIEAN